MPSHFLKLHFTSKESCKYLPYADNPHIRKIFRGNITCRGHQGKSVAPSPVNKMAKAYAYLMGSIHHVKRKNCYNKFDKLMDTYKSISLFIFVIQKSDSYALI